MKDKYLRAMLLSPTAKIDENISHRTTTWRFPKGEDGGEDIEITYRIADGLIDYLLRRIVKLEKKVEDLQKKGNVKKT